MLTRILAIVAVCASVTAAVGCGGSSASGGSSGSTVAATGSPGAEPPLGPKPAIPKGPPSDELIVKDLKEGTGEVVEPGDLIAVHYVAGIYERGEEIESAWVRNNPLGLQLSPGGVLPGWVKGLPGMRVGGRRELIFPATRAHRPIGSEPKDTLVYIVDVVGIE